MSLLADPVIHSKSAAIECSVGRRDSASWPISNVLSEPLYTDVYVDTQSQQKETYIDTHVAFSSKELYYGVL
jgi:hypothetical protein